MKKENLVFTHNIFKAVADSMIKVFIPLIILKESGNINYSLGYLIYYSIFVFLFNYLLKKIIEKYAVISIIIHFIPLVIGEVLLSILDINIGNIVVISLLMALAQVFYSVSLNIIFNFSKKNVDVTKYQIASNIGKLAFTLISGYVLSSNIKNSLLTLSVSASALYIISIIPLLFFYKELKERYEIVKENTRCKNVIKISPWFILFHIAYGLFQPVIDNILPLYLYINNLSFQSVTFIIALIELFKILSSYLAHFFIKYKKEKISVIIGSIIFVLSSVLLLFIKDSLSLYILSCVLSVSFPLTFIPMFKSYSTYLKENNNIFDGMLKRELDIFSFRPILYTLGFIGLGLYPIIVSGIAIIPFMLFTELKILNKKYSVESSFI